MDSPQTNYPAYQKPDLQKLSLIPTDYDFELYTDGSGHADTFGGHSVIGVSNKYNKYFVRAGAIYGTTTDRQEFEAFLNGLQGILDVMEWNSGGELKMLAARRPSVFWISDRENLVGSVTLDEKGHSLFKRKSSPDLWARYAFYETIFAVTAVHRDRNTVAFQAMADRISSECRVLIKNYIEILKTDGFI